MIDIDTFVDQDPYHMSFLDATFLIVAGAKYGVYKVYHETTPTQPMKLLERNFAISEIKLWIREKRWRPMEKALADQPESTLRLLSKWKTLNG